MEINALLQALASPMPRGDQEKLVSQFREHIRFLVEHDFERLVQLLYRVDIDEEKLRCLLRQQPHGDAAAIITALILERQGQKELTRKQFKTDFADDAEKW